MLIKINKHILDRLELFSCLLGPIVISNKDAFELNVVLFKVKYL